MQAHDDLVTTMETNTVPLAQALAAKCAAEREEQSLVEQHCRLRDRRTTLDTELQRLRTIAPLLSDADDATCRQAVAHLTAERAAVEAERADVLAQATAATHNRIAAAEAYRTLCGEAGRWWRTWRYHRTQAAACTEGWAKGEALGQAASALERLAALIGQKAAQSCSDDASVTPAWLQGV